MQVCVDIQAAVTQRAGVGRYTKALVGELAGLAGSNELKLAYFDFKRKGLPFDVGGAEVSAVRWCPGRLAQAAWKTIGWPNYETFAGKADLYHFPNFILPPLKSGRSVVTIHDVAFLRMPETVEPRNLQYLRARIKDTVTRADAVITVSEFSASEITELLDVDPSRVHAIWEGIEPTFTPPSEEEVARVRKQYGLDRPYLLFVGTVEPRKNIPFLVDVFEKLSWFDGDLVIAGMLGWKYEGIVERIQSSLRTSQIKHIDYVTDESLPGLYGGAELQVFPSLYEGFGFPPLESMACGTPVVSSSAGSLAEVLGDAAVVIDEYDADAWSEGIQAAVNDDTIVDRGIAHAGSFTWKETAEKTWRVYESIG